MCERVFPHALTTLFIKPAADNIFYPIEAEKEFDVCFPANGTQAFKGHHFVYATAPRSLKVLNLGLPGKLRVPDNVTSFRVLRPKMAENIARCKVGIVAVEADIDSCPRVIPEMLACGIPIVVLDTVRFWKDKYIESVLSSRCPYASGEITTREQLWNTVNFVLENMNLYDPRKYYEHHLSLTQAAQFIRDKAYESCV
jgi:hypothetical protein